MRIEHGERRCLVNHFDSRVWHNVTSFDLAQVLGNADDAVRVVADEIGFDEQFSDHACLVSAHATRGKYGGGGFGQGRWRKDRHYSFAPLAIHARIISTCSAGNGLPGGIC